MVLGGSVINDSPLIYLDVSKRLKLGLIFLNPKNTLCGVLRGSVLGPLPFLLYFNDIYNSSDKLSFFLFADDTNLLYADKNLTSLEQTINIKLINVCNWLTANTLSLNVKKSKFVIFCPYQKD